MADPKVSGIYAIRNTISGRVYVGSAKNIAKRWYDHRSELKYGRHACQPLQNGWNKYGASAFVFEVLENVSHTADLIVREQHWIDSLSSGCKQKGYNVRTTANSSLGLKTSDATKLKISVAHKGLKRSPETRARIVEALLQRAPTTPETRAKMSASHKGVKLSPEHAANAGAARRGYKFSEQRLERLSEIHRGKTISEEHRAASSRFMKSYKQTPEQIAKRILTISGRVRSEEWCRNISLGKRAAAAKRAVIILQPENK